MLGLIIEINDDEQQQQRGEDQKTRMSSTHPSKVSGTATNKLSSKYKMPFHSNAFLIEHLLFYLMILNVFFLYALFTWVDA